MDFDKYVNNELSKQEGFEWIKGVFSKARKQAIMNGEGAFKQFFKGKAKFPKFKKSENKMSKRISPKTTKGIGQLNGTALKFRPLEKKLKREQRSLSRKQEVYKHLKTKGGEPATNEYKRKNVQKNVLRVQKLHQRLANIRKEYVRSVVDRCVKTKPTYITIEDLNERGMMKNKHLSKAGTKKQEHSKAVIHFCTQF